LNFPSNLFWDSCVFIRYLIGDDSSKCYRDICSFVHDAKIGNYKIHFSTIVFTEIRQEHFRAPGYGSIIELFDDLGSNFFPIEPNPNILISSGELRSCQSTNPGDPNPPQQRSIGTPDAIHLVSCLYARDVLGVDDIVFHTFDRGKGNGWEGRTVPIIGFEKWFPEATRTPMVSKVCGLTRVEPFHPQPMLEGMLPRRGPDQTDDRP
jgi:hypothetical protein